MNTPTAITDFDFKTNSTDQKALLRAWMPEIEDAARSYEPDDHLVAFWTATMRLIAASKTLEDFTLAQVAVKAGYSRSTFFRRFESYTCFLLKGYQLSCSLSLNVYKKHLDRQNMSLDDFCAFTADVYFSAICATPNKLIQLLWDKHNLSHTEFHPHLREIAIIMRDYLAQNPQTQHLRIELKELEGVVRCLDLDLLTVRLEGDAKWGTPLHYQRLRKMLHGYFLACD